MVKVLLCMLYAYPSLEHEKVNSYKVSIAWHAKSSYEGYNQATDEYGVVPAIVDLRSKYTYNILDRL